jgi:hypothetical protein
LKINLQVTLNIKGTRLTKAGHFTLRYNQSVPEFAYEWIKNIKQDTGHRPTIIESVLINGTDDITNQVIVIESRPISDMGLPF